MHWLADERKILAGKIIKMKSVARTCGKMENISFLLAFSICLNIGDPHVYAPMGITY